MKRDVLHVVYVAFCVFVSVFVVALYARPRAVASAHPSSVNPPTIIYRTTYLVEYKYLSMSEKDPVSAYQTEPDKI